MFSALTMTSTGGASDPPSSSSGGGPSTPPSSGPYLPTFLLPSLRIPFHRRRGPSPPTTVLSELSSSGSSSSSSAASEEEHHHQPRPGVSQIHQDTLRCGYCATDIAYRSQIVSRGFTGRYGRALLVSPPPLAGGMTSENNDLVNVRVGRPVSRQLVTGLHVVADTFCAVCGSGVGWKYVDARDASQKYKVGKFILETAKVVVFRGVDDVEPEKLDELRDHHHDGAAETRVRASEDSGMAEMEEEEEEDGKDEGREEEVIVFDSDDEEECEDIFAGTWDAETVRKRRRNKLRERDGTAQA